MGTDFLYSKPSMVTGVGRVLDVGCQMTSYNTSATPEEADLWALLEDAVAVGQDLGTEPIGDDSGEDE